MDKLEKRFIDMDIKKLFTSLALPNIISALVMSIYGIIDGIFIGKVIGGHALAALNLVLPVFMISVAVIDMLAIGTAVQLSIRMGRKQYKEASSIFTSSMIIKFIYSIIFVIFSSLFIDNMLNMMGVSEQVASMAMTYINIFIMFSPVIMVSFALDNYLRICGKSKYSMIINVCAAILNIVLDYLLIVVFKLGIQGAALASCISMFLTTVASIIPFLLNKLPIKFTRPKMTLEQFKDIVFNGSSEFFTTIAASLSALLVNAVIVKYQGELGVAAIGIVLNINQIIISLMYGMGDSLQPAISYCYGANSMTRMWAIIKHALKVGLISAISIFILVVFFKDYAISMFVKKGEIELFELAKAAMSIYMFTYMFSWLNTLSSLFFTAINRPKESLLISLSHSLIFVIVGIFVLPRIYGINGVWLTFVFANFLTFILAIYMLIKWQNKTSIQYGQFNKV